jgi:hypothetical protein
VGITNVVQSETYASWVLNMNLTGATVTILCRRTDQTIATALTTSVTDAEAGVVRANVSELSRGTYQVQAKVTLAGVDTYFPDQGFETLVVNEQLTV